MTLEELKEYDGRDGRPVYVAYKGKIYDLSKRKYVSFFSTPKVKETGVELVVEYTAV